MMNDDIRHQFELRNPFEFKHIQNIKGAEDFQDTGPCVVIASPGMLQARAVRKLHACGYWTTTPKPNEERTRNTDEGGREEERVVGEGRQVGRKEKELGRRVAKT